MDTIFNYPTTLAVIVALPLFGIIAKFCKVSFERISKWYLYVAVFAVVIVMNSIFFPFIGGKDYFFRFSVELALISFVLWWGFEARPGQVKAMLRDTFKKKIVIAVTIFAVVFLLACLFAFDAHSAFWSNYERGEGGFQMIHYYLFFLLLALLFKTEDEWENIFKFSLISAGLMIIYGFFANLGIGSLISPYSGGTVPTGIWQKLSSGRFEGSLGNPAYVAPYLMFSMFYAAYLWVKAKARGVLTKFMTLGYAVMILIFLFFFYLSQTRGAFVGLIAGIFVMFLYLCFTARGALKKWSIGVVVVLLLLGVGILIVRNDPALNNIPGGRLFQISLSDPSVQTRFWVWEEAWKGFLEKPILGWGPENFTTVFDKFFNPNFFIPGQNAETWFDRAHSVFFDYLSETGLLGLLSYLGIFVVLAWEFFKRKAADIHYSTTDLLARGLILAMPVGYLVQGIAIFDVLPMYINLFLFVAFASFALNLNHHGHND